MNTWFTVKVKYTKMMDDGKLKRVTEPYLVDAVTFTDAEMRIQREIGLNVRGEFVITGISRTEYADVFYYEDSEDWYKCKLTYVSFDADNQKEKKITSNFLVTANSVREAFDRIKESVSDMASSFEIPAISLTNLIDVFPYDPEFEKENTIGDIMEENQLGKQLSDFTSEEREISDDETYEVETDDNLDDEYEESDVEFTDENE